MFHFIVLVAVLSSRFTDSQSSSIKSLLANEFETLEKLLEQEMNDLYYSRESPKEDLPEFDLDAFEKFNRSICELFSTPRSHENPTQKLEFQKKLKQKLLSYGYENVVDQVFRVRYLENINEKDELQYELGKNVIATLPGKYSEESKHVQRVLLKKIINLRTNKINKKIFNETITDHDMLLIEENFISKQKDKLLIVGAHYDTLHNVTGLVDNGSGSFALLELARLLKDFRFKLNYSIIFIWFDFEEIGALGSFSFVNHYLIPNYLRKERASFVGAVILDMLLDGRLEKGTKTSAEQGNAEQTAAQNDSISIWFRKESDAYLANQLLSSFNQRDDRIALFPVEVAEVQRIFEAAVENNTSESSLRDRFYLAGDHFSFWSISNRNFSSFSLPTVFLTTMAPGRGTSPTDCYHRPCDDLRHLTKENLIGLNRVIFQLRDAIINLDD